MPAISGDPPGALAISEVARLTGLTTATLRVWQRRYGLGASRSSPGGHRRYSPQDVARLRAVQRLVGQGLPTAEAVRVVLAPVEHGLDLPPEAHPVAHLLAAAALDLDGPSCRSLVRDHLATHPVDRTWEDVLRPVLAAVGERWAELPHGVAVEHVLSHVAAAALGAAAPPPSAGTAGGAAGLRPGRGARPPARRPRGGAGPARRRGDPARRRDPGRLARPRRRAQPARRSSCCSRCSRNSPIPGCSPRCHRPTASWPRARAGTAPRCPRRPEGRRPARRPAGRR